MSPQHTRKSFFAKLGAFVATLGIAPKLLAKPISESMDAPAPVGRVPFVIRNDNRAVARKGDTL